MDYYHTLREKLNDELLIMPSAIGAIVKDNQILLVKTIDGNKWSLPGGFQEQNESIETTVIREIKEELNIDSKVDGLISIFSSPKWINKFYDGTKIQQLMFFFKLTVDFTIMDIKFQENELVDYNFYDLDDLPTNMPKCCIQKCIDLKSFKGNVVFH